MTAVLLSLPLLAALSAAVVRGLIARPILDQPAPRKAHARPMPTAGGLGVAAAVAAGMAVLWAAGDPGPAAQLPLLAAAAAMAALGLLDDRFDLPALPRLLAQAAAAGVAIAGGLLPGSVVLPLAGEVPFGLVLTLLWFLGCTNAVNFLDGADGLAGGSLLVASLMLAVAGAMLGAPLVVALSLCLAAGLAGFLPFNWPPARIYLGDAGSQPVGFLLAGLGIAAGLADETRMAFAILPLLLAAQLFDAGFTLARRAWSRERVWQPHQAHLYQMVIRAGWPTRRVALLHAGFAAVHGLLAIWFLLLPADARAWPLLLALGGQLAWLAVALRAMRRAGIGFSAPP